MCQYSPLLFSAQLDSLIFQTKVDDEVNPNSLQYPSVLLLGLCHWHCLASVDERPSHGCVFPDAPVGLFVVHLLFFSTPIFLFHASCFRMILNKLNTCSTAFPLAHRIPGDEQLLHMKLSEPHETKPFKPYHAAIIFSTVNLLKWWNMVQFVWLHGLEWSRQSIGILSVRSMGWQGGVGAAQASLLL